ncbi:hypothetical protein BV22DRAFT_1051256 [Leucogyrophana mollusca]|uniref:Uncharacterized protein n=1 Tax=Leucogyrophana mollusca TaxID=85980 RepID=A0ACB8B0P6_9AGAM|nr:hypothetical protein BV22DRAFT_1051256 [Leucogyrophana mollusca]
MGRPRLHKTPQEKLEAARLSRKNYYLRNRGVINARLCVKYRDHQSVPSNRPRIPLPTEIRQPVNPSPVTSRNGSQSQFNRMKLTPSFVNEKLALFVRGSSSAFLESLFKACTTSTPVNTHTAGDIEAIIEAACEIQTFARQVEAEVLQAEGCGDGLSEAVLTSRRAQQLLTSLEDILAYVLSSDTSGLIEAHDRGELIYQKGLLWP